MKCGVSNGVVDQGRYGDRLRRSAVEKPLDLPVADHAIEQTVPARALARSEHRAHQRKHAGRLHQQPGRLVGHAFPVHLGQPPVEIVVHQRDRELGRTLGDLNAEFAQGRGKFLGAFDIDRFDPHGAIAEILLRDLERQAEARPISSDGAIECVRCSRNDVSALQQPLDRFLYLVGRKALRKLANDLRRRLSIFSDRGGHRTIQLAVQEELAVLGIEADHIGRKYIGGEVRRESQNVLAGLARHAALAIGFHGVSTRILLPVISDRQCTANRSSRRDLCAHVDWNCSIELEHTRLSSASCPCWQATATTKTRNWPGRSRARPMKSWLVDTQSESVVA